MPIRGVLIDLEGVLYEEGAPVPGAREAMREIAARGIEIRFLTNTTTMPRQRIVERLGEMGFEVATDQVFTPARAAGHLLRRDGCARVHLAANEGLAEDFADFTLVDAAPDAVVMGDLHTGFSWERLDGLFKMLVAGAGLYALHKNRYCRREGALALDLGPFVAALEYAAGIEARLLGKPSANFFATAIADMGLGRDETLMIGDDIEADIGGAVHAGLAAIQVRTGKFRPDDTDHATQPTARLASIADLPGWLDA